LRIELDVYSFNPRAEAVYQKVGFVLEGIKRKNFIYNGELFDTKLYAMLQSDYQNRK
jgi:RimJ/RimL family protein N-acetyltransferase